MGRPFRRGGFLASQPSKRRPFDRVPGTEFPLRALIIEQTFYNASLFVSVSARGVGPARTAIDTVVPAFIRHPRLPLPVVPDSDRGSVLHPEPSSMSPSHQVGASSEQRRRVSGGEARELAHDGGRFFAALKEIVGRITIEWRLLHPAPSNLYCGTAQSPIQ